MQCFLATLMQCILVMLTQSLLHRQDIRIILLHNRITGSLRKAIPEHRTTKYHVLLALTSPGVGFDLTKVSRDLES